ncbi:MAG: HNH endonuclease, partial [Chitinivibrionia bacterium]|nr:HNH endonuclease [Chitinivibrionia bacterium]
PLPAKPRQAAAGRVSLHPRHAVHEHNTTSPSNTRHIPASVRDEVFARDKGRCVYVGTTGERCESTQALQIDHIVPFARGGATIASNLRLLCAKHNRIAAEEVFGEAISRRYVARDSVQHRRE